MNGLRGRAAAPLTCGELVQGRLGGVDFLVSCPINLYTHAEVVLERTTGDPERTAGDPERTAGDPNGGPGASHPGRPVRLVVHAAPPAPKACQAVALTLELLDFGPGRAWVKLDSPARRGKGLGTSTADICAAVWAAARAFGVRLQASQVAHIALAVEPSDGTMFPGVALFDHRHGRLVRPLGPPPPMGILILDAGGEVDTVTFNRRPDLERCNRHKEGLVKEALRTVLAGIRQGDPRLVGRGATLSAMANQELLPKPGLEDLAATAVGLGAFGVVAAHSGTAVGVLLPDPGGGFGTQGTATTEVSRRIQEYLARADRAGQGGYRSLGSYRITGGGEGPA